MIIILELVQNDKIIEAHLAFYKGLNFSKIIDFSFILYFRYIIYSYIKENENKLYSDSFPVLIGNLLPSKYEINGNFDFNSFYQTYLLKMSVSAEKIVIYLTPFVLGIKLDIVLFEDKEKEVVKTFNYTGKSQLNIDDSIFVLNRAGHYETVFNYKDNQKYGYIYKYYINNIKAFFIKLDPYVNSENNHFIQQNQQNNYFQPNYLNNYNPQHTSNNNKDYQAKYNPQTNQNNNNPQCDRNNQYPHQMYGAQIIQNDNLLNQNNYNSNYNQVNYNNNNTNSQNYNNNYNPQKPQNQIAQTGHNINPYQNKEFNRENSQQIDKNNHNDRVNIYYLNDKDVIITENNSSNNNLNIYSLSELIKNNRNMNMNNNMNYNMDNNISNNMNNNANYNMNNNMVYNMNNNISNNMNNNAYMNNNMNYNMNNNMNYNQNNNNNYINNNNNLNNNVNYIQNNNVNNINNNYLNNNNNLIII